jgi:hypothetical protein
VAACHHVGGQRRVGKLWQFELTVPGKELKVSPSEWSVAPFLAALDWQAAVAHRYTNLNRHNTHFFFQKV